MSLLSPSRLRLLLVEDDEAKRYTFQRTLAALPDVELLEAKSGTEALQLVSARPDLVILDVGLPDLSGFELCRHFKAQRETAAVPILMVSSRFTESAHRAEGLKAGADGYLDFSGDYEEFREAVQSWLRQRTQAVRLQRAAQHVTRLYGLNTALARATTPAEVASAILDHALEALGASAGALVVAGADGGLDIVGHRGYAAESTDRCPRLELAVGTPMSRAFSSGQMVLCSGAEACQELFEDVEARKRLESQGIQALACVPLLGRDLKLGVLGFTFHAPQPFGDDEKSFIQSLAEQCALALDRAELYRKAQEAAAFQRSLLGVLAHDLRTPLMAMLVQTDLLRRAGDVPAKQLDTLSKISASGKRMTRIINNLVDVSRAQSPGGLPLRLAPTSLREVCRTPLDEVEATFPDRRVTYETEGEGQGTWDLSRLQQVVSNLLANALQYSPHGSVVKLSWKDAEASVTLDVWNAGHPIPPEVQGRLFQPFQRGQAHAGSERNLGLGLYIVREVVKAHRGSVEVRSSEADGTRFTVQLPK